MNNFSIFVAIFLNILFCSQNYMQIKVDYVSDDDIALFQNSGINIDHAIYQKGRHIEFAISEYDVEKLINLGYSYHIIHENLESFYASRLTDNYTREFGLGSMGGYYTLDEAVQRLDDIQSEYPGFVSEKISIGMTFQGRNIWAIKVTNNSSDTQNKPQVLYTGMHHAREPMSFMNLYYFIYWLLENYENDSDASYILDNRELWFIPIVNPDGYEYNRLIAPNGGGMQRKNMRDTCGGGVDGVDPNRNYSYQWGLDNQGSSPDGCDETYRGSSPFSEPENQAVKDFVESKNFTIALNYHSYSDLLLYPFGYTYDNPMNQDDLNTFIEYAQDMTQYNNYTWGTGPDILYPVNGEACDWMYGEQGIFAYTPEVGGPEDGFWPPTSRIVPLAEENLYPNIRTALYGGPLISSLFDIGGGPYTADEVYPIDLTLSNIGLSASNGIINLQFLSEPGIEFYSQEIDISDLDPRTTINLEQINEFTISPFIPSGTEITISLIMTLEDGSETISSTDIIIGIPESVLEYNFELNEDIQDWTMSGDSDWYITSDNSNEGSSSLRSGSIGNNQESSTSITLDAVSTSIVEFSYKVSSEYSTSGSYFYDGLTLYVDDQQIGQYQPDNDGQSSWIDFSISLSPGIHTLTFTYSKDNGGGSTDCDNTGCDDAAFIDNFILYSYVNGDPVLPGDINLDQQVDVLDVVLLVNFVLDINEPSGDQFLASDVNSDGLLNVLDVVQVVNLILD